MHFSTDTSVPGFGFFFLGHISRVRGVCFESVGHPELSPCFRSPISVAHSKALRPTPVGSPVTACLGLLSTQVQTSKRGIRWACISFLSHVSRSGGPAPEQGALELECPGKVGLGGPAVQLVVVYSSQA